MNEKINIYGRVLVCIYLFLAISGTLHADAVNGGHPFVVINGTEFPDVREGHICAGTWDDYDAAACTLATCDSTAQVNIQFVFPLIFQGPATGRSFDNVEVRITLEGATIEREFGRANLLADIDTIYGDPSCPTLRAENLTWEWSDPSDIIESGIEITGNLGSYTSSFYLDTCYIYVDANTDDWCSWGMPMVNTTATISPHADDVSSNPKTSEVWLTYYTNSYITHSVDAIDCRNCEFYYSGSVCALTPPFLESLDEYRLVVCLQNNYNLVIDTLYPADSSDTLSIIPFVHHPGTSPVPSCFEIVFDSTTHRRTFDFKYSLNLDGCTDSNKCSTLVASAYEIHYAGNLLADYCSLVVYDSIPSDDDTLCPCHDLVLEPRCFQLPDTENCHWCNDTIYDTVIVYNRRWPDCSLCSDPAFGVVVYDTIDAAITPLSPPCLNCHKASVISEGPPVILSCYVGNIACGDTETVVFQYSADKVTGESVCRSFNVTDSNFALFSDADSLRYFDPFPYNRIEFDSTNNSGSCPCIPICKALEISKSATSNAVYAGGSIAWRITVSNYGSDRPVENCALWDSLIAPTGYYLEPPAGGISPVGITVPGNGRFDTTLNFQLKKCTEIHYDSLNENRNAVYLVNKTGYFIFDSVDGDGNPVYDENALHKTFYDTVTLRYKPCLTVEKHFTADSVKPGYSAEWEIVITNNTDNETISGFGVFDTLMTDDPRGRQLEYFNESSLGWRVFPEELEPGESCEIPMGALLKGCYDYRSSYDDYLICGTELMDSVQVYFLYPDDPVDSAIADPAKPKYRAYDRAWVQCVECSTYPDLELKKMLLNEPTGNGGCFLPDDTARFSIVLRNNTDDMTFNNVILGDTTSPNGHDYLEPTGSGAWTIAQLPPETSRSFTYGMVVKSQDLLPCGERVEIYNMAFFSCDDPVSMSDCDSVLICIDSIPCPCEFMLDKNYFNPIRGEEVRIFCSYSLELTGAENQFRIYVMNLNKEMVRDFGYPGGGEPKNYSSYQDGEWLLTWDGKDSEGRKVGAGVYYIVKEAVGQHPSCGLQIRPITVIYGD